MSSDRTAGNIPPHAEKQDDGTVSPQRRRFLKQIEKDLYGMPEPAATPAWSGRWNWTEGERQ